MQSLPLMENIKGYPEWERKYLVWAVKNPTTSLVCKQCLIHTCFILNTSTDIKIILTNKYIE